MTGLVSERHEDVGAGDVAVGPTQVTIASDGR